MKSTTAKKNRKERRHNRVRSQVSGTASRPRLSVFRSLSHVYAQLVDDTTGMTLASVSSKELKSTENKTAQSLAVGKLLASKAKAANISSVVFDRGGNKYHGRVKALAEGAREGGLEF